MKVTREQRAENRSRILDEASRLFRLHGADGVGVAEITKAASLTHGGFYGHFVSKEALLTEALTHALAQATKQVAEAGPGGLAAYSKAYASNHHLNDPGNGCAIAALGSDVARQPAGVQQAFAAGVRTFLEAAAAGAESRATALQRVSALVGAMVIARAVADVDHPLAAEVLAQARGPRDSCSAS
jgi:TetR/AcrR family transcriptional repressor of nem operon